jgi:hypothetical protein
MTCRNTTVLIVSGTEDPYTKSHKFCDVSQLSDTSGIISGRLTLRNKIITHDKNTETLKILLSQRKILLQKYVFFSAVMTTKLRLRQTHEKKALCSAAQNILNSRAP